jgi:hypothetical protein
MPKTEQGIVKSPDKALFRTGHSKNGFLPLTREPSPVSRSNLSRLMHAEPGGSGSLAPEVSPVAGPTQRFDVDNVGNGQIDDFPVQPGKGAVPVNPFLATGSGLARAVPLADGAEDFRGRL